jgi:acetyltransferase-like isoleucine patch superfamily enzyme
MPFKLLGKFAKAIKSLILFFIVFLPGDLGIVLRRLYYKRKFKSCGNNLIVETGVFVDNPHLVSVGDNVVIDKYCIISSGIDLTGIINRKDNLDFFYSEGEIVIGNDVHLVHNCIVMGYGGVKISDKCTLSAGCKIYSMTNLAYDPEDRFKKVSIMPYSQAFFLVSPVVLKENVWLGLHSTVMPGVTIGQDSFSVVNSVIVRSAEENSYLSGNPATSIRNRFLVKK